ncbi:hypothetical protein [Edaphovirga cremea]|uniref:hypothetical protein n=1 Tax=Edaphovirga cremea TaxID=2267246 RepID=UPI003989A05E
MWHYISGKEKFTSLPDSVKTILLMKDGSLFFVEEHWPNLDEKEKILAHREWVNDDGWTIWGGGKCPLNNGTIDIRLRSGRFIFYRRPNYIGGNWQYDGTRKISLLIESVMKIAILKIICILKCHFDK